MARRRRKAGDYFLGGVLLLAVIVYALVRLYEKIGGGGYLVLVVSIFGVWFYVSSHRKAKDAERFESDAFLALTRRMDPETAKAMNAKYARSNHRRAELLRFIQIFNDSVEIALNSKKTDTAESRMASAKEMYQKIDAYRDIMSPQMGLAVDAKFQRLEANFISALTLNVAKSHIEKARLLKTEKSRMKYLQQALNVIENGISRGAGASPEVLALANEVRAKMGEGD